MYFTTIDNQHYIFCAKIKKMDLTCDLKNSIAGKLDTWEMGKVLVCTNRTTWKFQFTIVALYKSFFTYFIFY